MLVFFTPLHIIIAAFFGFMVGMFWYSPILFITPWLKGEGVSKSTLPKRSARYMVQVNVYAFLAHVAMATVLAIVFELLRIPSLKAALSVGVLLALGFIVTTRFMDMVYTVHGSHYEIRPQLKFLVSSGYYLVCVVVMSASLFLVSV
jgi:hypothetical protein